MTPIFLALIVLRAAAQDDDLEQLLNTCLTARGPEYVQARDRFLSKGPAALSLLKTRWEESAEQPNVVIEAMYLRARYPNGAENYEQWFRDEISRLESPNAVDISFLRKELRDFAMRGGSISGQLGYLQGQKFGTEFTSEGNILQPAILLAESLFRENRPLPQATICPLAIGLARQHGFLAERPTEEGRMEEVQRFERAMGGLWRELELRTEVWIRIPVLFGTGLYKASGRERLTDLYLQALRDPDPAIRLAAAYNFPADDLWKDNPAQMEWILAQIQQWWVAEGDIGVRQEGPECIRRMLWKNGITLWHPMKDDPDPIIREGARRELSRFTKEAPASANTGEPPPSSPERKLDEQAPSEPARGPDTATAPDQNSQPEPATPKQAPSSPVPDAAPDPNRTRILAFGAVVVLAGATLLLWRRSRVRRSLE